MPTDANSYVMDNESEAELQRLGNQDRLVTEAMGGRLTEPVNLASLHDVLDIACGSGEWVLALAQAYPEMQLTGIDISRRMIEHARQQTQVQQRTNAVFQEMNATRPLAFSHHSFDLVNARFLAGFLERPAWSHLLQECVRITRPGGFIRLTEAERDVTTSEAVNRLIEMGKALMQLSEKSFSSRGTPYVGVTLHLTQLLHEAGYINLQFRGHVINFSTGTSLHKGWCANLLTSYQSLLPSLIKQRLTTEKEYFRLIQQAQRDMQASYFGGIKYLLTVCGQVPTDPCRKVGLQTFLSASNLMIE